MTKQDKIKKVMDEFKRGILKNSNGEKVKSRKQALAIALSESEDYAEKSDLIGRLSVNSVEDALDILSKAGTEDIFEKAVYVDNAENRKLGRVGQEYSRGDGNAAEETTPNNLGQNASKKSNTTESKTTGYKSPKEKFKSSVVKDFDFYTDPSKKLNVSDFITEIKKRAGRHFMKVDYHSMSDVQKKEFDRVGEKLKQKGYRVEDNGGFGKVIYDMNQEKIRPIGAGTLGPARRTKEEQEEIDYKRSLKKK